MELHGLYSSCRLCPRECGVDRTDGGKGFCGETDAMRIAWAGLHRGEEPPVSGASGSGTVFFTGCTMKCVFCQNNQLSSGGTGREIGVEELSDVFLRLQKSGAQNINIVTGTHFIPGICAALESASAKGLDLPVVWNSSGYEKPDILEYVKPYVDLWLPDLKTMDASFGKLAFNAPDYPSRAVRAVAWMAGSEAGGIEWDDGTEPQTLNVILRHLVLPGRVSDSKEVVGWYSCNPVPGMILSLMTQYIPMSGCGNLLPRRPLTEEECGEVTEFLYDSGVGAGFIQGSGGMKRLWVPRFDEPCPFPKEYADKLWYWGDA